MFTLHDFLCELLWLNCSIKRVNDAGLKINQHRFQWVQVHQKSWGIDIVWYFPGIFASLSFFFPTKLEGFYRLLLRRSLPTSQFPPQTVEIQGIQPSEESIALPMHNWTHCQDIGPLTSQKRIKKPTVDFFISWKNLASQSNIGKCRINRNWQRSKCVLNSSSTIRGGHQASTLIKMMGERKAMQNA